MLGQSIHGFFLQCRGAVFVAVPGSVCVHISKPEIGREIDNAYMTGQACNNLLRGAVGQAAKHQLNGGEIDLGMFDEGRKVLTTQMRIDRVNRLSGLAVTGQRHHLKCRVATQQSQQLGPGIARRAEDGGRDRVLLVVGRWLFVRHGTTLRYSYSNNE